MMHGPRIQVKFGEIGLEDFHYNDDLNTKIFIGSLEVKLQCRRVNISSTKRLPSNS